MQSGPQWTPSHGLPCPTCGIAAPMIAEDCGLCPLCWADQHAADPDHTLGQAIAVQALYALDSDPDRVSEFVERLHHLAEHATRPAVTGLLSRAARDLESLAEESG